MPGFSRGSVPVRSELITFRATEEEKTLLAALAKPLGVRGKSEVIRLAIDCFLASEDVSGVVAKLKR